MSWFDRVRLYYENGFWEITKVRAVVGKVLTKEEFEKITGEKY